MWDPLRTYLYDAEPLPEDRFREPFNQLKSLVILGHSSSWDELKEQLQLARIDVVAVNLGENEQQGLAIVQRIAELAPSVSILGVSRRADPQTIIAAMRSGCSQFVAWPIETDDIEEAIARIGASRTKGSPSSRRICVIGSAGGAGATSIACNLAVELGHLAGRNSAIVDMNLEFGDVCSSFDCNPSYTIADICHADAEIDRVLLEKAMHALPCPVSILAAPKTIQEAHAIALESIPGLFRAMSAIFPYVVVDIPRSYTCLNYAAPREADHVLVVTQLGVPYIRNATRIHECLTSMGVARHQIKIVLNRCNSTIDRITPEDVATHFGQPVYAMVPNDYKSVRASLDFGHPIGTDAPSSPARVAIQQLARMITGSEKETPKTVGSATLLGKLWRRGNKVKA